MMRQWFFRSLTLFLSLMPMTLMDGLTFEKEIVHVKAELGDKQKGGVFKFTNNGGTPVFIKEVKTSCGCTTAELTKKKYLSGESGEIEAILSLGNRIGLQRKRVQVITYDDSHPTTYTTHDLTLEVDIPPIMEIQPRMLYWRKDEAPEAKTITITNLYEKPLNITEVTSQNESFEVKLTATDPGRKYILTTTPKTIERPVHSTLEIITDLPPEKQKKFIVYLRAQ